MTPLAASISDATIWSVTFDDTRSVDYDRNSFIIQATGVGTMTFSITTFRITIFRVAIIKCGT
jgi:hypothetical protein